MGRIKYSEEHEISRASFKRFFEREFAPHMDEYKISRAYRDVRVTTIGGGTTEIMKSIIGTMMGL